MGRAKAGAAGGGPNANWWGWGWYDQTLGAPGSTLTITEQQGSGAMRVFDYLRYAHEITEFMYKSSGKRLVIWLSPNTSWSCGVCFMPQLVSFSGQQFTSQIFIPATAQDTSFWSDAVNAHELGHWVMASYGTSPYENGPHALGCQTFPGQAWSEGWATGFSSIARADSRYYDKQKGTFFWFDIDKHQYSPNEGVVWKNPDPNAGLQQLMDENVHCGERPAELFLDQQKAFVPWRRRWDGWRVLGSRWLLPVAYRRDDAFARAHAWLGAAPPPRFVDGTTKRPHDRERSSLAAGLGATNDDRVQARGVPLGANLDARRVAVHRLVIAHRRRRRRRAEHAADRRQELNQNGRRIGLGVLLYRQDELAEETVERGRLERSGPP